MSAAGKPPPKDTTDSLFDALQAAKEKKHPHAATPIANPATEPPAERPLSKPVLIIAAAVLLVSALIWGLTRTGSSPQPLAEKISDQAPPVVTSAPVARPLIPSPAAAPAPAPVFRPNFPSADARRQQQIEAERDQRLARERAERDAQERERAEREREMDRERDAPLQTNDAPPQRAGDWRAQQPEGYVDDRPADDRPGEEGVVSRVARERGQRLDDPQRSGDAPSRDYDAPIER